MDRAIYTYIYIYIYYVCVLCFSVQRLGLFEWAGPPAISHYPLTTSHQPPSTFHRPPATIHQPITPGCTLKSSLKKKRGRGTKAVRTRWSRTKSAAADLAPRADIKVTQKKVTGPCGNTLKSYKTAASGKHTLDSYRIFTNQYSQIPWKLMDLRNETLEGHRQFIKLHRMP